MTQSDRNQKTSLLPHRETEEVSHRTKNYSEVLHKSKIHVHNILETLERTFLPVGSQIGKYRIIEEIDRGGMAVVYKAHQLDLDRTVALKVLPANVTINRRFVERFLAEAHSVAKLNHPNIVSIHEVSMENNIYYLAMDYVPGRSLFYHLNLKKPKLVDVIEIFIQLSDALAYSHEMKILHRDLKLNNVIMRNDRTPVLIDFGLAKAMEEEGNASGVTRTGEIMGSPAYMAPERIFGHGADARSDVCSLGIMLYETLTFKNPYLDPRSIHQTTLNVIEANPIPPRKLVTWLPAEIEAITLMAMHRDSDQRYQSMADFRDDLRRYQRGEEVLASPPSRLENLYGAVRKYWPVVAAASALAVFLSILMFLIHLQNRKEQWHWLTVYEENFTESTAMSDWIPGPGASSWIVRGGTLFYEGSWEKEGYVRLDQTFTRDIRVEFDVIGSEHGVREAGFFLYGDSPGRGYRFYLNHGPDALSGIQLPGSSALFSNYNPATFQLSDTNRVVIERQDFGIRLIVNDRDIGRIQDNCPMLGKSFQNIGFFGTSSSFGIDNVRISRKSVPILAGPTIVGDRFWEHGDFEIALDEYQDLLLDFSKRYLVVPIHLRIVDCMIRLGRSKAARTLILDTLRHAYQSEYQGAWVHYLWGVLEEQDGNTERADSIYRVLESDFGRQPFSASVLTRRLSAVANQIDANQLDSAVVSLRHLTKIYPRHPAEIGFQYLRLLRNHVTEGEFECSLETAGEILQHFGNIEEITAKCRVLLAEAYLGKGEQYKAADILNQCATMQINSGASWHAWITLAEIYEFTGSTDDALTVYEKVYQECPPSLPYKWRAGLAASVILGRNERYEFAAPMLNKCAHSAHPFASERLIAAFYSDSLSEWEFRQRWARIGTIEIPADYVVGRRCMMMKNMDASRRHFSKALTSLPPETWPYVRVFNLLGKS